MAQNTYLYGGQPQTGFYQPSQTMNSNQFGYQPQTAQTAFQPPVQSGYITRPVTGREEALGVQVDFFGPGTIMPDLGHGVIYLKRFNQNTGASDLLEFAYQPPQAAQPEPQYVTVEMFRELEAQVAAMRKPVVAKRKEQTNDSDE